jgi:flagellar biogenesis protein FliO
MTTSIAILRQATEPVQAGSEGSFIWMLVQTVLALGLVLLLAYVVLRLMFPRLMQRAAQGMGGKGVLRVLETVRLNQQTSLHLIEVAGRWYLSVSSTQSAPMLHELDAVAIEEAYAKRAGSLPVQNAKALLVARFAQVVWGKNNRS